MPPPTTALAVRLEQARSAVTSAGLDALFVFGAANLTYLTGLRMSAGAVVLTRDRVLVVADGRYADTAAVVGQLPETALVRLGSGESYEEGLGKLLAAYGWAAVGVEAAHLSLARLAALRRCAGAADPKWVESEGLVEAFRAVKDPWEQAILREAGSRLSAVAACILAKVSAGQTERQVAWDIEVALHAAGFERPAFETIVASGPHGARPHHRPTDRRLETDELVLLDFGGVLDGYAVDMTRTVPLGTPPSSSRRWLEAVGAAQSAAIAAVAPGRLPSDIDAAARTVLTDAGLGEYFVHGTGHGLGLEVHERPTIGPRGDAAGPVQRGMAFTVEPGVYLPDQGGVRIEDDVLVTAAGVERLTFDE
jgi:Xaa-Pro aminopeptidase